MINNAGVTASHTFDHDTVETLRMTHTPESSPDRDLPRWTSWPQKGKSQWVEINLGAVKEIASIGVYHEKVRLLPQTPTTSSTSVPERQ